MTRQGKHAPVTEGDFDDGVDIMLWNPALPPARWRRETLRALISRPTVLWGLLGGGSLILGIEWATGTAAVVIVAVGVLALLACTLTAVVNLDCFTTDHHHHDVRCRLERHPGEFFYRTRDFTSLGAPVSALAAQLISAVGELYATPAGAWLDLELPREAHRVVWEALCCLDRTRPARALAAQLAAEPDEDALAGAVAAAVAQIDQAVADLLFHLHGCVTVTRAWEAKLRHRDLAARTDSTLTVLREIPISQVVATAEPLPQSVFAYLTAARDLTDAGPFPWEHPAVAARVRRWSSAAVGPLPRASQLSGRPSASDTSS